MCEVLREKLHEYFTEKDKFEFNEVLNSVPSELDEIKMSEFKKEYRLWRKKFATEIKDIKLLSKEEFCMRKMKKMRKKDLTFDDLIKAIELYKLGLTISQIAKKIGTENERMYNFISEASEKVEGMK